MDSCVGNTFKIKMFSGSPNNLSFKVRQVLKFNSGLKITARQRTMPDQDDHLSWQTFGLPVILTRHVRCQWTFLFFFCSKFQVRLFYRMNYLFASYAIRFKAPGLNHYSIIFNILDTTNQKGNLTELKFCVARQHDQQQWKYLFEQRISHTRYKFICYTSLFTVLFWEGHIFYWYQVTMRLITWSSFL